MTTTLKDSEVSCMLITHAGGAEVLVLIFDLDRLFVL